MIRDLGRDASRSSKKEEDFTMEDGFAASNHAVNRRTACGVSEVDNQSSVLGDGNRLKALGRSHFRGT
jgi:hypothetical protein